MSSALRFGLRVALRLMVGAAAFSFEVHVKAAELTSQSLQLPNGREVMMDPERCLDVPGVCAVRTSAGEKFILEMAIAQVVLDQETSIVRTSGTELRLISGTVWVKANNESDLVIRSEFGAIRARGKSEFFVYRNADRISVAVTNGKAVLEARGDRDSGLEVPEGFENWMGRVAKTGQSQTGLPVAVSLKEHLLRWARLFTGKKSQFQNQVTEFHQKWEAASVEAAEIHRRLHDRKVASIEQDKARKDQDRKKVEARNKELRELLRRKVMEE